MNGLEFITRLRIATRDVDDDRGDKIVLGHTRRKGIEEKSDEIKKEKKNGEFDRRRENS